MTRRGDGDAPAEFRVEGRGDATNPRELTVRAGTEVVWRNRTTEVAFVRVERAGEAGAVTSARLPPFGEARLRVSEPGRYAVVVTLATGGPGGEAPARYGGLVVEP